MIRAMAAAACVVVLGEVGFGQAPVERVGGAIDLPSSKQIVGVVPGGPQRLSSMPVSMAMSPGGRWVVTVNGGYGSAESGYAQSLAVMDTRTGVVVDYPEVRTALGKSAQTLFSGLAFSADGRHVYASIASLSDPEGTKEGDTGSGVAVYSFSAEGKIAAERVMKIPMQALAGERKTRLVGGVDGKMGVPYPAAIAVVPYSQGDLLVANNLSDEVLLMAAQSGRVLKRFDLSESNAVPSTYPVAVAVDRGGERGYVALWNASEVVEIDLQSGAILRKLALLKPTDATAPGSHPSALAITGDRLYVALANRDAVAEIDISVDMPRKHRAAELMLNGLAPLVTKSYPPKFELRGFFDTRLPDQSFYGAQPEALAVSYNRVYVANMGTNSVAILRPSRLTHAATKRGFIEPAGFLPTEWLPLGLAFGYGKLYIASGKGTGTGPNNMKPARGPGGEEYPLKGGFGYISKSVPVSYIAALLHGSLAVVDAKEAEKGLKESTAVVLASNRMKAAEERIAWDAGVLGKSDVSGVKGRGPIKHVIYIIKENRTYDQVFGDLAVQGKSVGNGDKSLTMYGEEITPNQHKLALQFGVLDNFYDSAEVSGDGHVWSNTAIGTDYLERTWQIDYRGKERGYDFEGVVSQGIPLQQGIPDVNEPASGYLWGNLAKHGMTMYHFGEFISSVFCTEKQHHASKGGSPTVEPQAGPMLEGAACAARSEVKPGERLPAEWGGGVNEYGWAIPLLASNTATKPELVGHFAAEAPDFNIKVPDQVRVDVFLKHFDGWVADRAAGKDTMPNFVMLRLPNDHTAGTMPGAPTPRASVADNDLAIGRAVEAVSHSSYWEDTAFFILEDDAQNGADHVDAHRSLGLVVSKYAPHAGAGAFVDSRFYSTVSMVRTMETVLGLPPMNNNDALASMMGSLLSGPGDQGAFAADVRNRENGLIYKANPGNAPGAAESTRMDFTHADRADARLLNVILWRDAMGDRPVPAMLTEKRKVAKKDDDD